jgi:hypothetical protein
MAVHLAKCRLTSASAYSPSKKPVSAKLENEQDDAYDLRTWREHIHQNEDGWVVIPANALRMGLWEAAQHMKEKIKGKGAALWHKKFERGILILEDAVTNVKAADVGHEELFVNPQGKRGGGSRVMRRYPCVTAWVADVDVVIADTVIDRAVFERTFDAFGKFIGVGRWRVANLGMKGRFQVEIIEWLENHAL